jgi:carboxypeptidase family protein/TonB-dependent receptor-like protein
MRSLLSASTPRKYSAIRRSRSSLARFGWVGRNVSVLVTTSLVLFGIFNQGAAFGQAASAAISGTVRDDSGSVLTDVRITFTNTATGVEHRSTTGSAGVYALEDIPPGNYSAEVVKDRFAITEATGITLHVNQRATLDFAMKLGTVKSRVTVYANLSAINSTSSELGTVITTGSVNDLPLNGRNFTQLLSLTPGVSPISVAQNSGGGGGWGGLAIGAFTFPSVNGQRNRSNMFLLDGSNDLALLGNYNYAPIIDDIQEFKIQSNNDRAEFGGVAGGIINVVTKAGTNDFHGSAWDFARNQDLDTREFFLPSRNPLHQNQFGVSGGGPIVIPQAYDGRNKSFFFFTYEGFRQSQAAQSIVQAPTPAELKGDFSSILGQRIQLYNPFSTAADPAHPGEFLRDPFPGNVIPSSLLAPSAELYSSLFPPAGPAIPGGNLYDRTPARLNEDSYTGRIDHSFGPYDRLSGRVSYANETSTSSAGFPGALSHVSVDAWNVNAHHTHIFRGDSTLDIHFGRNLGNDSVNIEFPSAQPNLATSLIGAGFAPQFTSAFTSLPGAVIPLIGITGYPSTGGYNRQVEQLANTWEFGGDLTKRLNNHTFKVGYSYARNNFANSPLYAAGESFSAFQTSNLENPGGSSGAGTGDALASFLLGVPNNSYWRNVLVSEHGGFIQGGYAQDEYRVSRRISVTMGVRYDVSKWPVYGSLSDGTGYVGDMDLSNGTYIVSAVAPSCSTAREAPCIPNGTLPAKVVVTKKAGGDLHNTDYTNFQPRIGVAYRVSDRTAVRAGYGRSYDEWNGVAQSAQNIGGTWPSVSALNANSLNQTTVTASIGDPLGLGRTGVYPPPTPFGNASFYYDPRLKTPQVDRWNAEVARQLGEFTALSVAYVGEHARKLDLGGLFNTAEFPGPGDAATVASRRPFPYITPTNYDTSNGYSDYNALQVRLNRTASNGLTYLLSYTWSKSIDLACSGDYGVEGCALQDVYAPATGRSVSGFDLTQAFVASLIYELPFGPGKPMEPSNRFLRQLAANWQVNAIATLHSGVPYDVFYQGDLANTGNTFVQVNLVGDPNLRNPTPAEWINKAALAIPPAFTFGNLGRNSLRSDWFKNLDLSMFRRFTVAGRARLEIRLEAFNSLNNVVFGAPGNVINGSNFGVVTTVANTPRQVQLALKLKF